MKKLKIYKIITSYALIFTFLGTIASFSGCTKNKVNNDDNIYISVAKNDKEKNDDMNSNISNLLGIKKELTQENLDVKNYEYLLDCDNQKEILYVNKDRNYSSSIKDYFTNDNTNTMSLEFFKDQACFIIPDCYKEISDKFFVPLLCDYNINVKELNSNNDNRYLYLEYSLIFKDAPKYDKGIVLEPGEDLIRKGDSLKYKALFKEENGILFLIADKQIGMGCECENVQNGTINNFNDDMLIKISDANILNESATMSEEEADNFVKKLK